MSNEPGGCTATFVGRCRSRPALVASARSPAADWSGRTAARPRSAPASSPAPAISSTAAAAAGRASRGARRGRRGRRGLPARRELRVRGVPQAKASNRLQQPRSSSATIRRRALPPYRASRTSRAGEAQAQRGDGAWAFSSFHDQDVAVELAQDAPSSRRASRTSTSRPGSTWSSRRSYSLLGGIRRPRICRCALVAGVDSDKSSARGDSFLALTVVHDSRSPGGLPFGAPASDSLSASSRSLRSASTS